MKSELSTHEKVPLNELVSWMRRFHLLMDEGHPEWEIAIIFIKINLYYFTGTMQDGILVIPRWKEACLWVRRSFERATDKSYFPKILPMRSYRDAALTLHLYLPGFTSRLNRCLSPCLNDFVNISRSGM